MYTMFFFKDYRGSTPALWYLCLAEEAFRPCLRCCCLVKDSHWMWLHHTLFPAISRSSIPCRIPQSGAGVGDRDGVGLIRF